MTYDVGAESARLLRGEPPSTHLRLSRRVRFLPLAVDCDGDVAATLFLRRGVSGAPMLQVHTLERHSDAWHFLGGGGGGPRDDLRAPRPRVADGAPVGFSAGAGRSVRRPASSFREVQNRYVWYAELVLAEEVAGLRVGERRLPVAPHGVAVVVWADKPEAVIALDASDRPLGAVSIRRPPMMNRDAYRGD